MLRRWLERRRHRRWQLQQMAFVEEIFERINDADPCANPACQDFRAEIRARHYEPHFTSLPRPY